MMIEMNETKLATMMYRLPVAQQINLFRIFAPIGYYVIGKQRRGFLFLLAIYPISVLASSVTDTLANDYHWNFGISAVIGLLIYELCNYLILCDVIRLSRKEMNVVA